jgi:hypothetical protein
MKTYWDYEVSVDGKCKVAGGVETQAASLGNAITDMIYYQAHYPNAEITASVREMCDCCYNRGKVAVKNSSKQVQCPECKGKCPTTKIEGIKLQMPHPANRIILQVA